MTEIKPLEAQQLYRRCDPGLLDFETTGQLDDGTDMVGQSRAADAVQFGIDIKRPGYNLFVLGAPGSGRHALVRRLLETKAAAEPVPDDWCYVNNFAEPDKPRLLKLPAGRGVQLKQDMQQFVSELPTAISAAFESDDYRSHVEAIHDEFKKREETALRELGEDSGKHGIALLGTPQGFAFMPMKDERTIQPDEFSGLPEEEQERFGELIRQYGARLHKLMQQFPRWRREMQGQIRKLSRDTMSLAVGHLIDDLKEHYTDLPNVLEFFDQVWHDVLDIGAKMREDGAEGETGGAEATGGISAQRYLANLLVDHGNARAAPIIYEDNPTYPNLVGRVEQVAHLGTLVTNFTMIKPGALHRANGGYLILDIEKVLSQPYAWAGLKRALNSGRVSIESLGQMIGWAGTQSLEPEAMPLSIKVVLVGERLLYYLLKEYDPEFEELFKVAADFEDAVLRSADNVRLYARLINTLARNNQVHALTRDAVARLIEHCARIAEDAERLSSSTRRITDILHEADHFAAKAGHAAIQKEDIEQALAAQRRRIDRIPGKVQEAIQRDILLISVEGSQAGQVNGLAVMDIGETLFGHPMRITATARLGDGKIIDIEREAQLGRSIHSKGVMILSSFLGQRYTGNAPLSLSATLVFEQSYGPVEGDSASLAELCALLSVLAAAPIRQTLALTGSVNQFGQVQAIGGVNEKIEGFFDVCKARGLNGEQGVLIPQSNVKHLMLREDVVTACSAGEFHIYAVTDVDQAMELLTGMPAGALDKNGVAPEGSINHRVATRLAEFARQRRDFSANAKRSPRKRAKPDAA
ncbi:ATP-dependent protease La Type II [Georgfuchsia toluolica]|uniref:endopeptidase La n=1 Tax=Georgfuchsia toluolica TaxID=424218 RepID=A0A916N9E0_9PROT|nr:ATP-binding protein [Georgfuchsia toluolica]CAG4884442.1 ATP-dependent protease La Type II [Georgfuchsia toluolica]